MGGLMDNDAWMSGWMDDFGEQINEWIDCMDGCMVWVDG